MFCNFEWLNGKFICINCKFVFNVDGDWILEWYWWGFFKLNFIGIIRWIIFEILIIGGKLMFKFRELIFGKYYLYFCFYLILVIEKKEGVWKVDNWDYVYIR